MSLFNSSVLPFARCLAVVALACAPCTALAEIVCQGTHGKHLQGIATDKAAIYWCFTRRLVKTDMAGKVLKTVTVRSHHGDLTCHDAKVYVAVNFGAFNQEPGKADSWVYVYKADDLSLISKHRVPQLVHGAGGMACHKGRFVVVGGLPETHKANYVYEYDENLKFLKRHVLPSGTTRLGIQTACYAGGFWWFGCYGNKLLKTDEAFRLVGKYDCDCGVGIVGVSENRFLIGRCFDGSKRGKAFFARPDPVKGMVPVKAGTSRRETVLDRVVHIEKELVLDIPRVAPLCEGLDVSKQRVRAGDCELYCEQEGRGVPLVLLHGGPGCTHHVFHPEFSRARGFARVIYYDQRGCGQSDYIKADGYTVRQAVDDLENLRRALKVKKWVVLGHSYGGLLAQCYAVRYPESLAGMVLVCSATAVHVPLQRTRQYDFLSEQERRRIREVYGNRKLSAAQSVFNAHLNGDWKRQSYHRPSREQLARMVLYEWKHSKDFRPGLCRDMQKVDLRGAFEGCPIPTLLLESKWDLTWNKDKPGKLHKDHPLAKLVVFERSGHSPSADEPDRFFHVLRDFVLKRPKVPEAAVSAWKKGRRSVK